MNPTNGASLAEAQAATGQPLKYVIDDDCWLSYDREDGCLKVLCEEQPGEARTVATIQSDEVADLAGWIESVRRLGPQPAQDSSS